MAAKDDQVLLPGFTHDPATYRKLNEPFPTLKEANDSLEKFWQGVYALRVECRIPDLYMIVGFNAVGSQGDEGYMMGILHAGDELKRESMVAYAFGKEQSDRQSNIARLVSDNVVKAMKKVKKEFFGQKS